MFLFKNPRLFNIDIFIFTIDSIHASSKIKTEEIQYLHVGYLSIILSLSLFLSEPLISFVKHVSVVQNKFACIQQKSHLQCPHKNSEKDLLFCL